MHRKCFCGGGVQTLTANASDNLDVNAVVLEENAVITEPGKYEVQLNYNSKVDLTFIAPESGKYYVKTTSENKKYHILGLLVNDGSCSTHTCNCIDIDLTFDKELTANEKAAIELSSIPDSDWDYVYYNWNEGETDTITLEIYKVFEYGTITESGKYEVPLNYNGKTELTFIAPETGKYVISSVSNGGKFYYINGSSSSNYDADVETGEMAAGEEYAIYIDSIADFDFEFDAEYYNWNEGETDTIALEIYKVVEKEIELADLEEYTVSAGTWTNLTFSVENPVNIFIDAGNSEIYQKVWLDDGRPGSLPTLDGIYHIDQPGKYTLRIEGVDEDTVIRIIEPVNGDSNGDGVLNIRDAAFIARKLVEKKVSELPDCADFNGDGTVNIRDAAAIARYLVNK